MGGLVSRCHTRLGKRRAEDSETGQSSQRDVNQTLQMQGDKAQFRQRIVTGETARRARGGIVKRELLCTMARERLPAEPVEMTAPISHINQLGEESSVWFQLTPLLKAPNNPLTILMKMRSEERRVGKECRL